MLTPPAMLTSGVNANFSSGVIVVRVSYGRGISGLSGSAFSVGLRQSWSNHDHSKLAPSRRVPSFLVSKRKPAPEYSSTESSELARAKIGVKRMVRSPMLKSK